MSLPSLSSKEFGGRNLFDGQIGFEGGDDE